MRPRHQATAEPGKAMALGYTGPPVPASAACPRRLLDIGILTEATSCVHPGFARDPATALPTPLTFQPANVRVPRQKQGTMSQYPDKKPRHCRVPQHGLDPAGRSATWRAKRPLASSFAAVEHFADGGQKHRAIAMPSLPPLARPSYPSCGGGAAAQASRTSLGRTCSSMAIRRNGKLRRDDRRSPRADPRAVASLERQRFGRYPVLPSTHRRHE